MLFKCCEKKTPDVVLQRVRIIAFPKGLPKCRKDMLQAAKRHDVLKGHLDTGRDHVDAIKDILGMDLYLICAHIPGCEDRAITTDDDLMEFLDALHEATPRLSAVPASSEYDPFKLYTIDLNDDHAMMWSVLVHQLEERLPSIDIIRIFDHPAKSFVSRRVCTNSDLHAERHGIHVMKAKGDYQELIWDIGHLPSCPDGPESNTMWKEHQEIVVDWMEEVRSSTFIFRGYEMKLRYALYHTSTIDDHGLFPPEDFHLPAEMKNLWMIGSPSWCRPPKGLQGFIFLDMSVAKGSLTSLPFGGQAHQGPNIRAKVSLTSLQAQHATHAKCTFEHEFVAPMRRCLCKVVTWGAPLSLHKAGDYMGHLKVKLELWYVGKQEFTSVGEAHVRLGQCHLVLQRSPSCMLGRMIFTHNIFLDLVEFSMNCDWYAFIQFWKDVGEGSIPGPSVAKHTLITKIPLEVTALIRMDPRQFRLQVINFVLRAGPSLTAEGLLPLPHHVLELFGIPVAMGHNEKTTFMGNFLHNLITSELVCLWKGERERSCAHCGTQTQRLSWCQRCRAASYCSTACQSEDWRRHKHMCSEFEVRVFEEHAGRVIKGSFPLGNFFGNMRLNPYGRSLINAMSVESLDEAKRVQALMPNIDIEANASHFRHLFDAPCGEYEMVEMTEFLGGDVSGNAPQARTSEPGSTPEAYQGAPGLGETSKRKGRSSDFERQKIAEFCNKRTSKQDVSDQGELPSKQLRDAVLANDLPMCTRILQSNVDVNMLVPHAFRYGPTKETPLLLASFAGHLEAFALLCEHLADLELMGGSGRNPLMVACMMGHTAIAEMLLSKKASTIVVSSNGTTASKYAAQNGHKELVRLLVQATSRHRPSHDTVLPERCKRGELDPTGLCQHLPCADFYIDRLNHSAESPKLQASDAHNTSAEIVEKLFQSPHHAIDAGDSPTMALMELADSGGSRQAKPTERRWGRCLVPVLAEGELRFSGSSQQAQGPRRRWGHAATRSSLLNLLQS